MRYFCWNLVSTPSANSEGYPILKTALGSKRVRGRKKRKKARNQAPKKAVTPTQTRRRRRLSISVFDGPTAATPADAAAFEVPIAGVPTYFVASTALLAAGAGASGFGVGFSPSVTAIESPPKNEDFVANQPATKSVGAAGPLSGAAIELLCVDLPTAFSTISLKACMTFG